MKLKQSTTLDVALGEDGTISIMLSPGANLAVLLINEAEQLAEELDKLILEARQKCLANTTT